MLAPISSDAGVIDSVNSTAAVRLEDFDAERHSHLLRDWLNRPHVARWWGDPLSALQSSLQYLARNRAIIVANEVPVGFLCWRTPTEDELKAAGLADAPNDLVDIDILVGEPELIGRGIGPASLCLLLARLRSDPLVSFAGVGTSDSNYRAIGAFAKAGFHPFRRFQDPVFGSCVYMVADTRDDA